MITYLFIGRSGPHKDFIRESPPTEEEKKAVVDGDLDVVRITPMAASSTMLVEHFDEEKFEAGDDDEECWTEIAKRFN